MKTIIKKSLIALAALIAPALADAQRTIEADGQFIGIPGPNGFAKFVVPADGSYTAYMVYPDAEFTFSESILFRNEFGLYPVNYRPRSYTAGWSTTVPGFAPADVYLSTYIYDNLEEGEVYYIGCPDSYLLDTYYFAIVEGAEGEPMPRIPDASILTPQGSPILQLEMTWDYAPIRLTDSYAALVLEYAPGQPGADSGGYRPVAQTVDLWLEHHKNPNSTDPDDVSIPNVLVMRFRYSTNTPKEYMIRVMSESVFVLDQLINYPTDVPYTVGEVGRLPQATVLSPVTSYVNQLPYVDFTWDEPIFFTSGASRISIASVVDTDTYMCYGTIENGNILRITTGYGDDLKGSCLFTLKEGIIKNAAGDINVDQNYIVTIVDQIMRNPGVTPAINKSYKSNELGEITLSWSDFPLRINGGAVVVNGPDGFTRNLEFGKELNLNEEGNTLVVTNALYGATESGTYNIVFPEWCMLVSQSGAWNVCRGFTLTYDVEVIDGPVAVDALNSEDTAPVYYNLLGHPVANPGPGLYIVNGKKVIIR